MKLINVIYSVIAIIIFVIISLVYNAPVLSGQKVSQPDIVNYKGSAQEMIQHRQATGQETYWSNAMFGGMPTYQTGATYDYHYIKKLDEGLRFLPRPADYLFLMFAGFFFLGMVLFRDWKYAFLGACLFAMGTYFFQLFEAGHNSKVHAIAYFAPLTAGVILLYRRKYILGFIITALFMALELVANHPQMTYYLGLALIIYVLVQAYHSFTEGKIQAFFISSALAALAVALGLGMNATSAMATYEYGQSSTRGTNDVTLLQGKNPEGLDKDYITQWSYGKLETLNLFIPNFMGGGSAEPDTYKENLKASLTKAQSQEEYQYFSQAINYLSTYWGDQPFTSGPAYQGAVVVLLFILGLFMVKGRYKWWLLSATLLSILLAWGKNFMWFTDVFIDYFPFYDKFRAVSSILVIAEFTMPLLAVLTVYTFLKDVEISVEKKRKEIIYVGGGVVALLIIFYLFGGSLFDFSTPFEKQFPPYIQEGIRLDRIEMFKSDVLRTLLFVVLALALLLGYAFEKIKQKEIVILGLALLTLIDLWGVDKRYFNEDNYVDKRYVDYPFPTEMTDRLYNDAQANPTLMGIAYKVNKNKLLADLSREDTSHYRVFDAASSTFSDASTSYFVSSIGGYHGAKLQNIQNIIDVYFAQDTLLQGNLGIRGSEQQILDMLNTKYFVISGEQGEQLMPNPNAMGNAWFVKEVNQVNDANRAIVEIGKINPNQTAIADWTQSNITYPLDSTQTIQLVEYKPNHMVYESQNDHEGFAVFSEIYYKDGWKASIDGEPTEIYKTNYFLRGLQIPKGKHEITFSFEPEVVKAGSSITLISHIIFLILTITGVIWLWYKRKNNDSKSIKNN